MTHWAITYRTISLLGITHPVLCMTINRQHATTRMEAISRAARLLGPNVDIIDSQPCL